MDEHRTERRNVLKQMTGLGAAGGPIAAGLWPGHAQAGEAPEKPGTKVAYDPAAKFELKVSEVEFRRTPAGRPLMARIYQPQGAGPWSRLSSRVS